MPKTTKHPDAIARDKWKRSDEYKSASNPVTLEAPERMRQYLENRLEKAFLAGFEAGNGSKRTI